MIRPARPQNGDDGAGIEAALLRAARRARETARQNGTPLVIWQDGNVCDVNPDDVPLDEELEAIREYDAAKAEVEEAIPFDEAIKEIERHPR